MKALITGGTGFIGSRLALGCIEAGDSVVVLGQENTAAEAANRTMLEQRGARVALGSITDSNIVSGVVDSTDVVYHLAATQHEMNVPDERFQSVNVDGVRAVLEAAARAGVSRFVHASTIGVYGPSSETIDEDSLCRPDNVYGRTKLEGERVALDYADRLPVVVIRVPEVYGPGDRRLLKLFRALRRGRFFVIGRGDNLHHPIYVDDMVEGFRVAATAPDAAGEVLGLAGPEPLTTNDMVLAVSRAVGTVPPRLKAPLLPFTAAAVLLESTLRPIGVQPPLHRRRLDFFRKSFSISTEKARRVLGFAPRVNFEDGAGLTAAWYERMGWL